MPTHKTSWTVAALVIGFVVAAPQLVAAPPPAPRPAPTPKIDTILYGASYYPEYMPYERLTQDVELMKQAGVTVVRVGESTWTSWEPREGQFQFAWMERVLDALHQAGLRVILGTPTYSIPPWLHHKHPEILVTPLGGVRTPWQHYGPRQNMDISHPTYRWYCERVIRQIVGRFARHPAVIGYQIDNETSSYGTAGHNVQVGFVQYLKQKFGSVDVLNKAWGFAYWGQLVGDWDDFPGRDGILNPGYKLEWERYQRSLVTDFLAWQAALVEEYKRPEQFVMQDFHGGTWQDVDGPEIARHLGVVGINPYHDVQDGLDGWWPTALGDLARSLKRANYLVTETNAQAIGWDSKGQFPPYDGQLRLNVYAHVASGANLVAYWHWHSLHYGQETYWKGVLGHDLEPNRVSRELAQVAGELKTIGPRLANLQKRPAVAILHSVDSLRGLQFMPFSDSVNYQTVEWQWHKALYQQNVEVDFVFPETEDLAAYKVLVVPPLYVASDALLTRLVAYVQNGGHLLMSFKSGFANELSTVRWVRQPGPLRAAAGVSYQEFSTLKQPLPLKGDPFEAGAANRVSVWAELLEPEGAQVLASYEHPFFGRWAAITRHGFGKGTLTYVGTHLSDGLAEKVALDVVTLAGLSGVEQAVPRAVRLKQGRSAAGRPQRYFLNYSAEPQTFVYAFPGGTDLLTNATITRGQTLTVAAWGLAIVEER